MRVKRLLCSILAIAMVLSTMGITSFAVAPTEDDDVALLAGHEIFVKDLQSAFTAEVNPDMKQVLMAKNWTGDIEINYPGFFSSFYLNGYTLEGQLKLTDLSTLTFYGIEPGNDWAGTDSKIVAPDYTIYQTSGANLNISGAMTIEATNDDGIAIYAENGKVVLTNKDTVVKGKVVSTGTAIVKISAGTYMGGFEADGATNLEITGGTFAVDPSAYLPSGFTAIQGDDNMYTIQKPAASLDDLTVENGKYIISTPEDVVTLREVMSKQSIAAGTEFVLANNIDMAGYTLASAGTDSNRFGGIFDGNDCTIFNVTIEGGEDSYVAFFGNISGATIKDLTLENVKVTGGQYTAGIVGRARSSTVTNCKVIGNIEIEGHDGVGAIVGGGVANVTGCEVSGNDGSYIKGQWDVGGISGLVSAGTSTVESNSVANVDLTAEYGYAGGIAGRVLANGDGNKLSISYNEVEDIAIESGDDYSSALLIGVTVTGGKGIVSYTDNPIADSSLTIDGVESNVLYAGVESDANITVPVAKIGDTYYNTLKDAIAEITDNTTITIVAEVKNETIKLPAVLNNFMIDGNGMTIKDTTINAADGNSINYQGFTVKDATFDNSRFVLGGARNGDVIYKNITFDNNKFINIVNNGAMGAVHMQLSGEDNEYVENFTFTNNVIDGVSGTANGVMIKQAKGTLVFDNNVFNNIANNALQLMYAKPEIEDIIVSNNEFSEIGGSVINLYGTNVITIEDNNEFNLRDGQKAVGYFTTVAKIDNTHFTNIQLAVDAAEDGDVITLVDDVTFSDVLAYADRNAKTWNGSYAFDLRITKELTLDLNGFTLKSTGGSDVQHYAIICVDGKGNLTVVDSSDEKTGAIINATTSRPAGKMSVVLYNEAGDITLNGGTYSNQARVDGNYPYVIDSITAGDTSLTINEGVKLVSDGYMTLRAMSQGGAGTQTVNINGGEFEGGIWAVLKNGVKDVLNFTISGGTFTAENAFIVENYAAPAEGSTVDTVSITGGTFNGNVGIGANNVANLLADGFISGGTYTTNVSAYAAEGYDVVRTADRYVVEAESAQADSISIEYKDITAADAEGEKIYEVVVKANDDDMINELASVDISFAFATAPIEDGDMAITVLPATDFTISRYENTDRYMFNYNGTSAFEGTDNAITVATITVTGYGSYTIATAEADTNIVNATTVNDNLVDSYTAAGATDDDATTGALVINDDTVADDGLVGKVENDVIAVPTRTLTIDITFPNAVENNIADYQDMTVTIVGGTVNETIALGTDGEAYNFTRELPYNTAYTVTVSGAGYRTARYTVNLNDDKQLNFWNNVMDEAQVVEIGKDSSIAKVTFLAGDIVKDNNINIYDLSAVVSYFGTENLVAEHPEYAKYDLNRDGVIDSKDVAYVLVSWNN